MIYAANKDRMTWYYLEYGHHVARLRHWAYQQSLPQANVARMSISMHERGFLPIVMVLWVASTLRLVRLYIVSSHIFQ